MPFLRNLHCMLSYHIIGNMCVCYRVIFRSMSPNPHVALPYIWGLMLYLVIWDLFYYKTEFNAWISNYIQIVVWMSNYIPHTASVMINHPCPNLSKAVLAIGAAKYIRTHWARLNWKSYFNLVWIEFVFLGLISNKLALLLSVSWCHMCNRPLSKV